MSQRLRTGWNKMFKSSTAEDSGSDKTSAKDIERSSDEDSRSADHAIICQAPGEGACEITGCVVLHPKGIVVADRWNMSLKLLSTDASKPEVISCRKLKCSPFDLTLTPGDKIAVTVPEEMKIVFASIQKEELSFCDAPGMRKRVGFDLFYKCYGIKCSDRYIYVVIEKQRVDQLLMLDVDNGSTLKAFSMQQYRGLRYVTIFHDIIYMTSDSGVLRFKKDKGTDDIKVVERERFSHGIIEVDGDIIVCNKSRNSVHTVSQSKLACFAGRRELLAIPKPLAICYCPDTKRLFVSQSRESGISANVLTVCQMKKIM
ncbi:uncharacterized protein LOC128212883 [Mya arenaria]|uniref:uncharacterized protein LOC128212883 n=1 Tax=Mya arenaria TaxID=6604 RepID=UPI0022E21A49|nr:uncharacterized protein LOC128212883 [Mya arenaria]